MNSTYDAKVAIIGTSNSILRNGWTASFLRHFTNSTNFSLGASPSLYAHYILEKHNILEEYDYVILDFSLNDDFFILNDRISISFITQSFSSLLAKISSQKKCIPIYLGFINKQTYLTNNFSTYTLYKHLLKIYGIPYLAIEDLIKKLHLPIQHPDFFLDDWHIARSVSYIIGEYLLEGVEFAAKVWNNFHHGCNNLNYLKFSILTDENLKSTNIERKIKSTSLREYEAYTFQKNSKIRIKTNKCLCGVLVAQEAAMPSCISVLNSENKIQCFPSKNTPADKISFKFISPYFPLFTKSHYIVMYGREYDNICNKNCYLTKYKTVSLGLLGLLFVENFNENNPIHPPLSINSNNIPTSIIDYSTEASLKELTQKILKALSA